MASWQLVSRLTAGQSVPGLTLAAPTPGAVGRQLRDVLCKSALENLGERSHADLEQLTLLALEGTLALKVGLGTSGAGLGLGHAHVTPLRAEAATLAGVGVT